jgi:glucosamine-6-phosphate deaminase
LEEDVEWGSVCIFHMDEYAGLTAEHPQSFRTYLRKHLLERIGAPRVVHLIAGEASPEQTCAAYARALSEKPLDLVCMGIGENGHLAFNDPPVANFADPELVKLVELDLACRQQQVNDGCFATLGEVPTHALTLTIPALLSAAAISCVVPGERKAAAVAQTLLGPVSTACPASILRTHANAVLHVDPAALSQVS